MRPRLATVEEQNAKYAEGKIFLREGYYTQECTCARTSHS
jgi:hypothetical protein